MKDLSQIIRRVEARVARSRLHQQAQSVQRSAEVIALDYAARLAEKAKFRRLLSDEAQDGLRFRFYFNHMRTTEMTLDQIRSWIDSNMRSHEQTKSVPSQPLSPPAVAATSS